MQWQQKCVALDAANMNDRLSHADVREAWYVLLMSESRAHPISW